MQLIIMKALHELGNSFDEQELSDYLEDPWITNAPSVIERYLHGECDKFAIALSKLTGFPMYAFFEERLLTGKEGMRVGQGLVHVFVSANDCTTAIDVKGERPLGHVLQEYGLSAQTQAVIFNEASL